jgi:hypothetical protein
VELISLILTALLFYIALKIDLQNKKNVLSYGAVVPLIWLAIALSRNFSRWMSLGQSKLIRNVDAVQMIEQGNSTDRILFSTLFIFAIFILFKRRAKLSAILKNNMIWVVLILYCIISISWSDFPFISLKRMIKDLNAYLMVFIILTESNPYEAFKAVIRRIVYLFIPLSLAFCKFFPNLGRYQTSSWDFIYTGVTTHKNKLGVLCLITILILFSEI